MLYTLLGGFLIIIDVLASSHVWLSAKSEQVPAKKLFFLTMHPGAYAVIYGNYVLIWI